MVGGSGNAAGGGGTGVGRGDEPCGPDGGVMELALLDDPLWLAAEHRAVAHRPGRVASPQLTASAGAAQVLHWEVRFFSAPCWNHAPLFWELPWSRGPLRGESPRWDLSRSVPS
ncbi:hypothetical protein LX15_003338 [Streptoalloteichus tenebrarius]|uniref:Uncharacterized protein n=1 Tax=Streptoalloteichus tenebrarius (strain ATCC 17920 / DSM 40477 / JCM 4838 / CBS 697.72 / NBRC 16177 / NCIMB 11028 / NRRL B-12390 / A12253. 1 / ISP 5477) TaxID=1933 RepID=A0ABT1HVU3_STRSD|nr:hypothetical protein [Streptoalloteichus tenebrarius]